MDKAPSIDAFVLHTTERGKNFHKLGELGEMHWSHLGDVHQRRVAQGQHAFGDSLPGLAEYRRPVAQMIGAVPPFASQTARARQRG
jgi:hypothetical protein